MLLRILFLCFVFAVSSASELRGIKKKDIQAYLGNSFTCKDNSKTIPTVYVNDDYCDCEDGSDEPGTSACPNGRFWCVNKGFRGNFIQSSRVNDGLCDCCDGSDEYMAGVTCKNFCEELGREAQKGVKEEIQAIEEGYKIKLQWIEEGKIQKAQKEAEIVELKKEIEIKEKELEVAKAEKEKEEEIERIERERLDAIFAASQPQKTETETQSQEATSNDNSNNNNADGSTEGKNAETQPSVPSWRKRLEEKLAPAEPASDQATAEVEAFPYPIEYAYKEGDKKEEKEEAFPYPKEYAAPPSGESDDKAESASESGVKQEDGGDRQEHGDDTGDDTVAPPPAREPYKSEVADKARKVYSDAEEALRSVENRLQDAEDWLKQDFGPDLEFVKMWKQCYSTTVRQYTYEICAYNKAEQQEGGRGTSLGNWKGFVDVSELSNLNIKPDGIHNKAIKFDDGQSCWQGPARSLTVTLQCGVNPELHQVEEPNRCVYTAMLRTPAVCNIEHAKALRLNLESGQWLEEQEE